MRKVKVVMRKAGTRGHTDDGEINPARQHHHGLTRGENAERRGEQQRVRQPDGIDDARFRDSYPADERDQQQDQHDDRIALQPGQKPIGAEEGRAQPRRLQGSLLIYGSSRA